MNKTFFSSKYIVIFCGLIWGVIESTLGWFVHLLHLHGFTPLFILAGVICMTTAVVTSRKPSSAINVAFLAASVKMMNLFLITYQPLYWVISPATHILLQGLVVALIAYSLLWLKRKFWNTEKLQPVTKRLEQETNQTGNQSI